MLRFTNEEAEIQKKAILFVPARLVTRLDISNGFETYRLACSVECAFQVVSLGNFTFSLLLCFFPNFIARISLS